jgi:hypothetical protein
MHFWGAAAMAQSWSQRTLRAAAPYQQRLTAFWNSDTGLGVRLAAIALVFPAVVFIALVVHFKGLADLEAGRSTKPAIFQDRWPRAPFATLRPSVSSETGSRYVVPNPPN